MKLLWQLAFRNTFRNVRRTFLSVMVISIGFAALFVSEGWMSGMIKQMIFSGTDTFVGHAQIHHTSFIDSFDTEWTIESSAAIKEKISKMNGIKSVVPRVYGGGMISSSQDVSSATIYGVDPEPESRFSNVSRSITDGRFLQSGKEILLGWKLAGNLQAQLGDRIVVTVANSKTGELSQELFRLIGIFKVNSRPFDEGAAFIPLKESISLFGTQGQVHEFAIKFDNIEDTDAVTLALQQSLGRDNLSIRSWKKVMPQIYSIVEMTSYSLYIMVGLLFILVFFSVMNSLLMSLRERMYEFGVLIAIGTRPNNVFKMILMECFVLALLSLVVGLLIGMAANGYLYSYGVDFAGTEISGVQLHEPVHAEFTLTQFTEIPFWVLIMTLLSGIYPAFTAKQIVPQEALRKSL